MLYVSQLLRDTYSTFSLQPEILVGDTYITLNERQTITFWE